MSRTRPRSMPLALLLVASFALPATAQRVTTPQEQFGHEIGADYVLPNYDDFVAYWHRLSAESDRMVLDTIGTTAEGRPQLMAIITSPENHRNLARYQEIARRLALAEGVSEEEARQLAREGKAVVWFDGGLHATEVLGAQQLIETVYQLVSGTDPETTRFMEDLIILAVHANPDGMQLVSNWYMRHENPEDRSSGGIPRLYQKYVGHDNNRDFFASTQPETENMNQVMYREWFPQIVYNHHQTGPRGAVLFAPPYRDPFNHNYDPLIMASIDQVGSAMHARFLEEGKGGATMRSGANYSTWWNGGLRTMPYFHNMIGLLTETIGNPTPIEIPFVPDRQIPHTDLPMPIEPQTWHFRQSIDYSVTANKAVFDYASDRRENLLFNIWRMGMNSIERGSTDSWTNYPRRVMAAEEALEQRSGGANQQGGFGNGGAGRDEFMELLRKPEWRNPRGYILPSDQPDFPTAAKFVEALLETGIAVHRATGEFQVGGKTYPAGSFVVKTAQAFAPHVFDMFEPQDHPNDFEYPGAPPTPPYDAAGWTLAFQMGVEFDRILEGFDGPFEEIQGADVQLASSIAGSGNAGFVLRHEQNDAFLAVNRLLAAGRDVLWMEQPFEANGTTYPAGTFFVPRGGNARQILEQTASETGITVEAVGERPRGESIELDEPVRIALWDRYGGSMPSGWTRFILENFEFPFEVVYPQRLDEGDLADDFDVIVFVDGAIPPVRDDNEGRFGGRDDDERTDDIPEEFRHMLGNVSAEQTIPQIREFLEEGGTVITIGSSAALAQHLGLPISDHLVSETGEELEETEYYVPGSVLEARVDNTMPVAHGLDPMTDFFFDDSPVFRLGPDAAARGIRPIAVFEEEPLRSGWAWGQQYLTGGVAAIEADVGEGKLFMFGPEVLFRSQPHGTFKLVFNGIHYGAADR